MRSSNYWLRYRKRRNCELTWPDQEPSRKRRKNRRLRTRASSVPDTRKILCQRVTSFSHKVRTWLSSDQMDYDIMGWREGRLDVTNAAEEAGRLKGYRSIWTPANPTGRGGTSGETTAMIRPRWRLFPYWKVMVTLRNPRNVGIGHPFFFGI